MTRIHNYSLHCELWAGRVTSLPANKHFYKDFPLQKSQFCLFCTQNKNTFTIISSCGTTYTQWPYQSLNSTDFLYLLRQRRRRSHCAGLATKALQQCVLFYYSSYNYYRVTLQILTAILQQLQIGAKQTTHQALYEVK